jgi:hypothetical protein
LAWLYSIEWGSRGSSVRETFFGLGCRLVIQLMSRLVFFWRYNRLVIPYQMRRTAEITTTFTHCLITQTYKDE